jgi:hypothetical protein
MTADIESVRARRYLLGNTNDEETAVIEQEYFENDDAVDRIAAAEDDLIEDYLAGQLTPADRDRFERGYLSVPAHRIRVETIRRLMTTAARGSAQGGGGLAPKRTIRYIPWLALAASLLIVASAAFWMLSPFGRPHAPSAANRAAPATPSGIAPREQTPGTTPNAPRVFAVTISPVAVRSAAESASIVVPAATDVVALRLESEGDGRQFVARRVSIRTVTGTEVWQGPVVPDGDRTPGVVGRVNVPAASLPADDYMVTLYGADRRGVEREWTQYFLRLRAQ